MKEFMSLYVDSKSCIGCAICELVCAEYHEKKYGTSISRIRVARIGKATRTAVPTISPLPCDLCDGEPRCVPACPTKVIEMLPTVDIASKLTGAKEGM